MRRVRVERAPAPLLWQKTHPHADATYSIVPQKDMTYGVEVSLPGTHLTLVTGLATEQDAAAWIEKHKQRVEAPLSRSTPPAKHLDVPVSAAIASRKRTSPYPARLVKISSRRASFLMAHEHKAATGS